MHTTSTPDHPGEPATAARRPGRLPLIVLVLAVLGLAVAGPARAAFGSEFEPEPHVAHTEGCIPGSPAAFRIDTHLTNTGLDYAHFETTKFVQGVGYSTAIDLVSPGDDRETYWDFHEGESGTLHIVSSDDASIDELITVDTVDCTADPVATIVVECPARPGGSATVTMSYANPSHGSADFVLNNPNGTFLKVDDVHDQATPIVSTFPVAEDTQVKASILADGKTLASIDQKVDCAANVRHITIAKQVIPDFDNPVDQDPLFSFTVKCGILVPSTVVTTVQLHGGESTQVEVPDGQFCSVAEVDPGEYWAPSVSTDLAPYVDGLTSKVVATFQGDHRVDITNAGVPHPSVYVTKHVIGGAPGQTFDFVLHCKGDKGKPNSIQMFQLGDGDTAKLSTFGTDGCVVTEAPPGGQWGTTHQLDAGLVLPGTSQAFESHFPHSIDFVNRLRPDDTTTTTSTTTSTTRPETTTTSPDTVPDPTTTVPPTTEVPTTEASTTTEAPTPTTEVEVSAESVVPVPLVDPPADPPTSLARTGSDVFELAGFGLLLITAGALALAVVRRRDGGATAA